MTSEKMFTQADLNNIIGERIGRLKEKRRSANVDRNVTVELRKEVNSLRFAVEELKHIVEELKGE